MRNPNDFVLAQEVEMQCGAQRTRKFGIWMQNTKNFILWQNRGILLLILIGISMECSQVSLKNKEKGHVINRLSEQSI